MANVRRTTKLQTPEDIGTENTDIVVPNNEHELSDEYSIWETIDSNTKYISVPGGMVLNYNGNLQYINGIRYNKDAKKFERF